jgi:hypothetical protein
MRIYNAELRGATEGGEFQGNLTHNNGMCQQVLVKPASDDTTYDFKLINNKDIVVYERTYADDKFIGTLADEVSLPILGTYTAVISNASKDEQFTICLVARED